MKIGIISDIHGNIVAFKACQEYLEKQGCTEFVYLGDYVSDTPYPVETMEYLYQIRKEKKCHFIRGNREEYMLAQREAVLQKEDGKLWKKNSASGNLLFTFERLREKDFEFFDKLPISFVYEQEGYPSVLFCHGSPNNARELLQHGGENTRRWLEETKQPYIIAGHTHLPGISCENGKYYINTGSCGIAIADCGYAQCLMLESEEVKERITWKPHLLKVPYNQHRVVEDIFKSGLYEYAPWFISANIHIFLTGIDKCAELVDMAQKKAQEEKRAGECAIWPEIDEKYFAQAAAELQIPDYGLSK